MNRIEGYINLDEVLKNKNVDITNIDTIIQSPLVKTTANSNNMLLLELDNELYYFKYKKFISPYNELIINELAYDFGISTDKNLESIFARIESKTGCSMPQEMKDYYLKEYQEHRKELEEVLDDENIRKR